jgi:hypothetical protein
MMETIVEPSFTLARYDGNHCGAIFHSYKV